MGMIFSPFPIPDFFLSVQEVAAPLLEPPGPEQQSREHILPVVRDLRGVLLASPTEKAGTEFCEGFPETELGLLQAGVCFLKL